jgi:hypothetical protein
MVYGYACMLTEYVYMLCLSHAAVVITYLHSWQLYFRNPAI